MPIRSSSRFRTLAVGLTLIFISATLPGTRARPRPAEHPPLVELRGPDAEAWLAKHPEFRARHERRLQAIRDAGVTVRAPIVFAAPEPPQVASWWDRLFTAHAQYGYSVDGGYGVINELDDGDPSTHEFYVDAVSVGGAEVTGGMQASYDAPDAPWDYSPGGGIDIQNVSENRSSGFDRVCEGLSPTLEAQAWDCSGGFTSAWQVLRWSFGMAAAATSPALWACVGFTLGYGACLAGSFYLSFVGSLVYNSLAWRSACNP